MIVFRGRTSLQLIISARRRKGAVMYGEDEDDDEWCRVNDSYEDEAIDDWARQEAEAEWEDIEEQWQEEWGDEFWDWEDDGLGQY